MGGSKTYAEYLVDGKDALINHKHMQPPEAFPPQSNDRYGLGGGIVLKRSPKREAKQFAEAQKRAKKLNSGIRNEIVRQIAADIQIESI